MDIQERLALFYRRLEAAPPAATTEEAMALVCRLIEEVEDEFCPLPREEPPPALRFTGRMYAPQKDRMHHLKHGVLLADARRHRIYCQPDGAILIEDVYKDMVVLTKDGKTR